jgi:APA family basic amino acid/polyamine antiporter
LRNPWLVIAVWVFGGVFAFFATAAVTELGTMLPREGGWYVYSRAAFGEYGGFLVGCCDWMAQTVPVAYLAVAFAEFASGLQPSLEPYIRFIAAAMVGIMTLLNWLGLRAGSRAQELTSLIKALALLAFVVACFVMPLPQSAAAAVHPAALPPIGNPLLGLLIAMQSVLVTYDGWYSPIYFMEEDRDPARNLPRSAIGGALACIAIFLLVNVALLHVLPMNQLAASATPAAEAAALIFGSHGKQIILIISIITVLSGMNACILISSRVPFAMGRDGLLPRRMAAVNAGGTPSMGLLVCALVSIGLVLSGTFETLIAIASFLYVSVYLSGFLSLFRLRARRPDLPRPFRAWGYPWSTAGVLLVSAGFLVGCVIGDIRHSLFTLVLLVATWPIYVLGVRKPSGSPSAADSFPISQPVTDSMTE